jgi:hypothetical protein
MNILPKIWYIIYDKNKPIAFTISEQEAEDICSLNHNYQWDSTKNINKIAKLKEFVELQMIIIAS